MSVLPPSATLLSFFIVLVTLVLFTISTGLYLSITLATIVPPLSRLFRLIGRILSHSIPRAYLHDTFDLFDPSTTIHPNNLGSPRWFDDHKWLSRLYRLIRFVFRRLPAEIIHGALVPEILFPKDQWIMFQYRNNRYIHYRWHPLAFIRDFFRLLLIPVWIMMIIGIIPYIVAVDLVFWVVTSPFTALRYSS